MALSDMKVFSQYVRTATIETLTQDVEKFNASSNGAIVLTTQGVDGDYLQESFWANLSAAQRRVNRYDANSSVSATPLTQGQVNSVKVAGGFGPISFEPAQLAWIQTAPEEAIEAISRNLSSAIIADQLNTGILAAVAAIANNTAATNDVSATAGVSQLAINAAHAKFGDASGTLVAQVMDGASYHKLIGEALTNANTLFQAGNVTVVNILGRPVIVTDAPALYSAAVANPAAPAKSRVLSLTAGGIVVSDGSSVVTNMETKNGGARIESTFQADYDFTVGVKGYSWDVANGGKSPDNTALGTGSNWDLVAASVKGTAGVITIGDATK